MNKIPRHYGIVNSPISRKPPNPATVRLLNSYAKSDWETRQSNRTAFKQVRQSIEKHFSSGFSKGIPPADVFYNNLCKDLLNEAGGDAWKMNIKQVQQDAIGHISRQLPHDIATRSVDEQGRILKNALNRTEDIADGQFRGMIRMAPSDPMLKFSKIDKVDDIAKAAAGGGILAWFSRMFGKMGKVFKWKGNPLKGQNVKQTAETVAKAAKNSNVGKTVEDVLRSPGGQKFLNRHLPKLGKLGMAAIGSAALGFVGNKIVNTFTKDGSLARSVGKHLVNAGKYIAEGPERSMTNKIVRMFGNEMGKTIEEITSDDKNKIKDFVSSLKGSKQFTPEDINEHINKVFPPTINSGSEIKKVVPDTTVNNPTEDIGKLTHTKKVVPDTTVNNPTEVVPDMGVNKPTEDIGKLTHTKKVVHDTTVNKPDVPGSKPGQPRPPILTKQSIKRQRATIAKNTSRGLSKTSTLRKLGRFGFYGGIAAGVGVAAMIAGGIAGSYNRRRIGEAGAPISPYVR